MRATVLRRRGPITDQIIRQPAAGGHANGARPVPRIVASPAGATSMTTSPAARNPQFGPCAANPTEYRAGQAPPTDDVGCANFVPPTGIGTTFVDMPSISSEQLPSVTGQLTAAVQAYRHDDDLGALLDRVKALAAQTAPELLAEAAQAFRDLPEVVIPVYERLVAARPSDAQAMVVLANAYWLTGRGPDVVGDLAARALAVDPSNRAAWHLWALAEPQVRKRVARWHQVVQRFPADPLARAALADNAASLAGAEHDPGALDLALTTYEGLLAEAMQPAQRGALEAAIATLRTWRV
jgi:hypothetical protein